MNLGFLGGSFDPPHNGHFQIANDAIKGMNLDKVYFLPAKQSPHKKDKPAAGFKDRIEMLQAYCKHFAYLDVLDIEKEQGAISYSLETVKRLKKKYPKDKLYWILGADQAETLNTWYQSSELAQLIDFIVFKRPGYEFDAEKIKGFKLHPIPGTEIEVSSTEIRSRLEKGLTVDLLLPHSIVSEINSKKIY